jgi:hypothetical protein
MSALTLPARPLFINNLESNPVFLYWKTGTGLAEGGGETSATASGVAADTENYDPLAFNGSTTWTNLLGFKVKDWGSFFRPGLGKDEEITDVIISTGWNPIKGTLFIQPNLTHTSGTETKTLESYFVVRSRGKELEYQEYSENYDRKFNMQIVTRGSSPAMLNNNYCIGVARYVQEMVDAGFKDLKYTLYSDITATTVIPTGSHSALNALVNGTTVLVIKIEFVREGLEFHKFVADDTYQSDFTEVLDANSTFIAAVESDSINYYFGDFFEGIGTYNKLKPKRTQTPANVYPYSGNEDSFPVKGAKYTSIYVKKRIARPDLGGGVVVNQESAMTAEFLVYVNESVCNDFIEGFIQFLTNGADSHYPAAGGTPLANITFNMNDGVVLYPEDPAAVNPLRVELKKGTVSAVAVTATDYPNDGAGAVYAI